MKYITNLVFLFICLFLNACSNDNNDERPETLGWIEDTMREKYYWNSEIPNKLAYTTDEKDFFKSLLSNKDGKTKGTNRYYYSYIEKASESTRGSMKENYTYGFEFTTVSGFKDQNGTTFTGALILYVYPNTPAAKAGLKRGEWIVRIDGEYFTSTETIKTLYGDVAKEFMVYQWNDKQGFINGRLVPVEAAESITNYSPIYHYDKLTASNGKQVGYMIYDRFQAGKDDKGKEYDDELRQLSHWFSGIDEFILDLRYNNGGLLSSTQLLCTILGPSTILSKNIGYMEYADGTKSDFSASQSILGSGKNLNLPSRRLYVLTSSTTASASEAVINLLDPYMDVIVIGEKTEGKNVGSQEFVSDDKVWEMHPITSKIFNSDNKSDYSNGWDPDHILDDVLYHYPNGSVDPREGIVDLGDEEERLLKVALHHIVNGSFPAAIDRTRTTKSTSHKLGINSLDRKAAPIFID